MGCAFGTKVPGLPGKDHATALKAPLNQIGNAFCPFLSGTNLVPHKVGPPGTAVLPQKEFFLHTCISEKARLSRSTMLCLFHTMRDSAPLVLWRPYLKATQNLHPVFLSSKPDLLFLMSNHIIKSLLPLLANGCAWS